ncbi:tetratricopeptide repeat protein [Flexithrix dorotheae]|uniref:tetratricopeptide repeat protein n=1 Tax=Flexithrix dorotheae TaxID=70993 RepID=UPI00146E3F10|nr:tetratricopeptide repeat protein [Flexithrix dorotheae]
MLIFLIFLSFSAFPQSNIDSLKQLLNRSSLPEKIDILLKLSGEVNGHEGVDYAIEALNLAKESGKEEAIYKTTVAAGEAYTRVGEYIVSRSYFQKAYKMAMEKDDWKRKAFGYRKIANTYTFLKSFDTALIYQDSALFINQKNQDYLGQIIAYNNLSSIFGFKKKLDSAEYYILKAYDILEKTEDVQFKLNTYKQLGYVYIWKGEFNRAESFLIEGLKLARLNNESFHEKSILTNLAIALKEQGLYEKTLKYLFELEKLCVQNNYYSALGKCFNSIANVYNNNGDWERALEYYRQALNIHTELNDGKHAALELANIGWVYKEQNQLDSALYYYKSAIELKEQEDEEYGLAYSLNEIGSLYILQKDWEKAHQTLHHALKISSDLGLQYELVISLNHLGNLNLRMENLILAEKYLLESEALAKKMDYSEELLANCKLQIQLYQQKSDYRKVVKLYSYYDSLKTEIYNAEKAKSISEIKTKYETEKKEEENKYLKSENELKEAKNERQKLLLYFIGALAILFLLIAIAVVVGLRNLKRKNTLLKHQREIIQKQQIDIRHQTKNGLQRVCDILYAVSSQIEDEKAALGVREGQSMVTALSSLQEFLYGSQNVNEVNMPQFLEKLKKKLMKIFIQTENPVKFNLEVQQIILHIDIAIPLALIISELITNSFKHAFVGDGNHELKVSLVECEGRIIELLVEDNGKGIDLENKEANMDSVGLRLISSFVKELKGNLELVSDKGTKYRLAFDRKELGFS